MRCFSFGCAAAIAYACSNGGSVAPTTATAKPQTTVAISLTLANTQWNTAVPDDFVISVSGGGHPSPIVISSGNGVSWVSVDRGSAYKVTVSGPEGYQETLSDGCAGGNPQDAATCAITEKEAAFGCDAALWDPVYRQDRLRVLSACETAIATITSARFEQDGDADILADPDPPFRRLLGPGNDKEAGGKLVIEIPCQGPISQSDAIGTCSGFKGARISPPLAVGERILAAAHWVEDKNHGNQRELHGARVRRLPR